MYARIGLNPWFDKSAGKPIWSRERSDGAPKGLSAWMHEDNPSGRAIPKGSKIVGIGVTILVFGTG